MIAYEKEISSLAIKHIKELTGRGPKNIYVKVSLEKIEIHFWLQKSPLEKFVYDEIGKGKCLVNAIYSEAIQHRISDIEDDLSTRFHKCFKFCDFDMDIDTDKYTIAFCFKQ